MITWSQLPRTEMIALADIRQDGHGLYFLEVRCPACGTLLGKTFAMIGRQLAENYEQVRLAAALTAQPCPSGCHGDPVDRARHLWGRWYFWYGSPRCLKNGLRNVPKVPSSLKFPA